MRHKSTLEGGARRDTLTTVESGLDRCVSSCLPRAGRLRASHRAGSQLPLPRALHDDVAFAVQVFKQVPEAPLGVGHVRALERLLHLRRRELRVALLVRLVVQPSHELLDHSPQQQFSSRGLRDLQPG